MSGQDYIGSKISLISLSDIRYVGTLHSINTSDSTVSLENVRSFGTEGRRGNPDDEVMASDTVFDFVVFRGSDIKDLQVFEAPVKAAPPPPPPPSRPQNPPIRHSMEGYPPMNPYMMPPYPPQAHQAMYWQSPMYPGQQPPLGQPPMQPPTSQQEQQQQQQLPPQQQNQQQQQQQQSVLPPTTSMPQPPISTQPSAPGLDLAAKEQSSISPSNIAAELIDQQEIDGAAVENLAKQVSELDTDIKETEEAQSLPPAPQQQPQQQQQQQRQQTHQRQNNYRNGRHANGPRTRDNNQNAKQRITIPQSDFDFESSNAKFSKNDLLKELIKGGEDDDVHHITNDKHQQHQQEEEEVIIPPNDEEFYDKSKSFFDNISCESKERQDQDGSVDRRGKFHEERKLNMETFGQASVDQSRFRNFRGRGGYRGGYRGNRGGYYRGGNRSNYSRNTSYGYRSQQQQQQVESQQQ
ncbi:Scd6-like Sm domain-containing protein [Halteromyces radiatus]|uniref:Scd6-like Sm domain-containing protein n=1 Tax=Halteromyces radiatus TaxID=101107 RepID=UPI00221E4221|nr:Scd6-like Sm domain-containing protein [Halteromyces radiatus]KAI8082695.1 Scd6-like Sm domain-containing protein [Halteromyces radiatus]